MDYIEFEQKFKRIKNANLIKEYIIHHKEELTNIPKVTNIKKQMNKWLPEKKFTCLDPKSENCTNSDKCSKRCSWKYWRNHSFDVANLMKNFAIILEEDINKWELAGLIHDFDYLKFPHHIDAVESAHAHPIEICSWLIKEKISYDVCLAVLEHAPHLRLSPSSKLSFALIACDEFTTMTGCNYFPSIPINCHPGIRKFLSEQLATSKFSGFVRNDMEDRFHDAINHLQ